MGDARARMGALASAMGMLLLAGAFEARAQTPGQWGDSCVFASDCQEGLVCREGRCTPSQPGPPPDQPGQWEHFQLYGAHGVVGLTLAPGTTGWWYYGSPPDFGPSFFFGIRGGVLLDKVELTLELAPMTWVADFDQGPILSLLANIGGYVPIAHRVYWPLRFGLGMSTISLVGEEVHMQGRIDLLGITYQYGHLLFEINLPSIRFHTEFTTLGVWSGLFCISVTYVI